MLVSWPDGLASQKWVSKMYSWRLDSFGNPPQGFQIRQHWCEHVCLTSLLCRKAFLNLSFIASMWTVVLVSLLAAFRIKANSLHKFLLFRFSLLHTPCANMGSPTVIIMKLRAAEVWAAMNTVSTESLWLVLLERQSVFFWILLLYSWEVRVHKLSKFRKYSAS